MTTLAGRVLQRFQAAARRVDLTYFQDDTYYPVSLLRSGFGMKLVEGYATKDEIAEAKENLKKKLADTKEWIQKYKDALKTKKGVLWERALGTFKTEEGIREHVKQQEEGYASASKAKSLDDLLDLFAPATAPGFYNGEPMLFGGPIQSRATGRAIIFDEIVEGGNAAAVQALVNTGAKFSDRPNFGDGASETLDAAKWLGGKRRKIIEKAMTDMSKLLADAEDEARKKYLKADFADVMYRVQAYEAKWRRV